MLLHVHRDLAFRGKYDKTIFITVTRDLVAQCNPNRGRNFVSATIDPAVIVTDEIPRILKI